MGKGYKRVRTDRKNFDDIYNLVCQRLRDGKKVKEIAEEVGWTYNSLNSTICDRGLVVCRQKGEKLTHDERTAVARMSHLYIFKLDDSKFSTYSEYCAYMKGVRIGLDRYFTQYFRGKRYIVEYSYLNDGNAFDMNYGKHKLFMKLFIYSYENCPSQGELNENFAKLS